MNEIKRAMYLGIAAACLIGIADASERYGDRVDVDVDTTVKVGGDELYIEGDDIDIAPVQSVSMNRERQAPNIYNLAGAAERDCGKVVGISGSNTSGGWALGIPIPRSWAPTCDFWKAASEAKDNGHGWTSYMFMCQITSIHKVWGDEACDEIWERSLVELGILQPILKTPTASAGVGDIVLAQNVAEDDYQRDEQLRQEQHELVEYRQTQQQNKIESLEQAAAAQQEREAELAAEIERLRQEAEARQKTEDESRETLRQSIAKYQVKENE